jgi:lipoyl(octanoyl) transferase
MNVSCNLEHYRHIIACGISDRGVTSMERELSHAPSQDDVTKKILAHTGEVLGCTMLRIDS